MNRSRRHWSAACVGLIVFVSECDEAMASEPSRADSSASQVMRLEEIVVTGSRLKVRDAENAATVAVFDRARIEELGVVSIAELVRYVPQMPYAFADGFHTAGAQFAEMRGLGVDTTLVLINGRRTVPSAANVAVNAFDLNTIPLAAVERVEVLSDSASAVYGADAVGGVINIVLKRELERPLAEMSYGAAEGGGEEQRASLSGGYSGERVHGSLIFDYFQREYLLGLERERWADQDFRSLGGADWRAFTTNPGNISSRTTANLPGLPSRFAAVPDGSTGVGLTPADFSSTAGVRRSWSPFTQRSIVSEAERRSAMGVLEVDLSPSLTAFTELMYVERRSARQLEPSTLSNARVPASNPFNPFGVDVSASYSFDELGPRTSVVEQSLERAVLGVRGPLGAWDWEVAGLHANEDSEGWIDNAVDATLANAALASTDPATALNVFQDGPGGSEALLSSLITRPLDRITSGGQQLSAFVRGPLFRLPAGALEVVVGGERREEEVNFDGFVQLDQTRTVDALFAEARVPLVNADFAWPAMRELSITVAGRQDRYSDFGESFNPQYSLRWAPHRDWLVSASYGTSFRAPAIFELFSPRREVLGNIVNDPRRNGEQVGVRLISGGNPELDPVEGESWTSGVVFTPASAPSARFAAHYWSVELDGRVEVFTQQLVLAHERLFPERVLRQAPSPADIALGQPGPIDVIDVSRINFGRTSTSGVDASASYGLTTSFGTLYAELSGTWINEYDSVEAPGTTAIDRVGIAHLEGSIPEWRAVGTLGWSRGPLALSTTARYTPGYEDRTILGQDMGRNVESLLLFDAQLSLDLAALGDPHPIAAGFKLTLGVVNLFDEEPPFAEIFALLGYDQTQGDLRQRFAYARLSYQF